MAEKRKNRNKRKEESTEMEPKLDQKPNKTYYRVADWMRTNVPIKRTKFLNHNVEYFTGQRAVDQLIQSPWAQNENALFKTREEAVNYLHTMLLCKFFHRARKIVVETTKRKGVGGKGAPEKTNGTDEEQVAKEGGTEAEKAKGDNAKQRKRKIRLEMHNDQRFMDTLDAYVWIYDPIPFYYWIIGTAVVLGSIGLCLFPLWPPSVRLSVYYLSVACAGFLVGLIMMVVLRVIIFSLVWLCTIGRHHLWIMPNLTEDVGFFASFWPLYTYEYRGPDWKPPSSGKSKKSDGKKKSKDKNSDTEDKNSDNVHDKSHQAPVTSDDNDDQVQDILEDEHEMGVEEEEEGDVGGGGGGGGTKGVVGAGTEESEESESTSSQRSSTGKDFEIVDHVVET